MNPEAERPPFLLAAVWLNALEGLLLCSLAVFGFFGGMIGMGVAAEELLGSEEQWLLVAGGVIGGLLLFSVFGVGIFTLVASWRAWTMSRPWLWGLLALSAFRLLLPVPWSVLVFATTAIGTAQAVERSEGTA